MRALPPAGRGASALFALLLTLGLSASALAQNSMCPIDLDENGAVDSVDLVNLVGQWGPCGGPCPADFDDDGAVTPLDLILLVNNWGECTPYPCLDQPVLTLLVRNDKGETAGFAVEFDEGEYSPETRSFVWCASTSCDSPFPPNTSIPLMADSGKMLAELLFAEVEVTFDSRLNATVRINAGPEPVEVEAITGALQMTPIQADVAEAQAGCSATVSDVDCDGVAAVTGIGPPGAPILVAEYNTLPAYLDKPGVFSGLLSAAITNNCWPFTATGSSNDPPQGYRPVEDRVLDTRMWIGFRVTPFDYASVTAKFWVQPTDGPCDAF